MEDGMWEMRGVTKTCSLRNWKDRYAVSGVGDRGVLVGKGNQNS